MIKPIDTATCNVKLLSKRRRATEQPATKLSIRKLTYVIMTSRMQYERDELVNLYNQPRWPRSGTQIARRSLFRPRYFALLVINNVFFCFQMQIGWCVFVWTGWLIDDDKAHLMVDFKLQQKVEIATHWFALFGSSTYCVFLLQTCFSFSICISQKND